MKKPRPGKRPEPRAAAGDPRRASLVLAAMWALLFGPQLFASRGFVFGDTSSIRAFAEYSGARWREHHERTHWNPYVFAGLPATASLQDSRPQWLPDVLLDAFDRVHRLPGFPPLTIPLLVHLAGMLAMAALARSLWQASTLSMIWAGVAWGLLPGQLVPLAFGQDWLVMSSSLMPVILFAVARVWSATTVRGRLGTGLGLSLATASMFLAAHPQIIVLTLPLTVVFAVERMRGHRRTMAFAILLLSAAAGVAMAAAVWWPAHLYNAHTVRGGSAGGVSLAEIASWSAGIPDLVSLAWPWAAGFGGGTYWGGLNATDFPQFLGTTVFALALLGLARRDGSGRCAWVLAGAAVFAVLLALGLRLGALYQAMYTHVPLWSSFRVASRALIVCQLAFALLSARGFEQLVEAAARAPRRWLAIAGGIAGFGLLFAALLHSGFLAGPYAAAVREARPRMEAAAVLDGTRRAAVDLGWRSMMLAVLLAAIAFGARGRRPWARGFAIVLLALDLGSVSVPFLGRATGSLERIANPSLPAIARRTALDATSRALDVSRERLYSNDWIRWRARSLIGNHPAVPRIWDDLWQTGAMRSYPTLCALAVRYLGGAGGLPPDTLRFEVLGDEAGGGPLWRLKGALPRAYAVSRVTRLPDDRAVIAAVANPGLDPRRDAFTAEDGSAGEYPGSASCRVRWIEDAPDRLRLEASCDSPAFLVIADTWFPGWSATLDGRPCRIHRVQHMLRGLVLPAGDHRLRLFYEPEGWRASERWTWGAWILWLAGAGFALGHGLRRSRRAGAGSRALEA